MNTIDKLSTTTIRLQMQYINPDTSDKVDLAIGTGFFWSYTDRAFLITNLHNVTGRHFETDKPLDKKKAAVPSHISGFYFSTNSNRSLLPQKFTIPLYDDNGSPLWKEHTNIVDIAVLSCGSKKDLHVTYANEIISNMAINVAQDVFVLGYPKDISVQGLPIWKRASIASEPEVNAYKNKPSILIDTATKEGMSGSPVFAISKGPYRNNNGGTILSSDIAQSFVGVYSGRLGKNEFEAQLGIVWKKELIDAIVGKF
ncbi:MAG: trypsin-like peptidase domain-containing protein [Alphaproteobacteria bacterium]|nr:trypsin-like peptidase domain-containing protein [Alphaproteobacteria bacterium]